MLTGAPVEMLRRPVRIYQPGQESTQSAKSTSHQCAVPWLCPLRSISDAMALLQLANRLGHLARLRTMGGECTLMRCLYSTINSVNNLLCMSTRADIVLLGF
jgi:hypothetical protein